MKTIHELLIELNACSDAREWAKQYETIEDIVKNCHRGDWLLWLSRKVGMELRPLTLAKSRCAKTVIHLMKDQRSINAVNVAEAFGLGGMDIARLNAADAAYAAYAAADAAAAAAYAAAAADAADAAAAAYAAYAAYAAAAADAAYAAYATRSQNQNQTAQICRDNIGELLIELTNKKLQDEN